MSIKKISNLELEQLVVKGYTVSEIARELKVTKGAISKRLKALNVAIAKNVTLHHAGEIVEKKLDVIAQLGNLNQKANTLLDTLSKSSKSKDRALSLRTMAEIRSQLSLSFELMKTLVDVQAIQDFQEQVVSTIEEEIPETRDRIINRLRAKFARRGVFHYQP